MQDAKVEVLSRLLELARLIRKRGTPDQAEAVLPYERQLSEDLETARRTPTVPQKEHVPA